MATKPYKEKPQEIHAKNVVELKERIKNKNVGGCYIFYGDEDFLKDHYSRLLVSSAGSDLNTTTFYGSEFTLPDLLSACETSAVESFDMFSMDEQEPENSEGSYRVVKIYNPDFSSLSKSDNDYLQEFLGELSQNTIVIFWLYAGNDEAVTKGALKKIGESSLIVNFKREPIGSSVLLTWITRHFSKEKIAIDRYVALHICQQVGNSMTDLRNEITKLIEYLKYESREAVTKEDVDFICIKSSEAQVFDISSGALSGNFQKAARALRVLEAKKEKPILILGAISKAINDLCLTDKYLKEGVPTSAISKLTGTPEFIIKNCSVILSDRKHDFSGNDSFSRAASLLCIEYDKKLKSSRTDGYELLLELIFKLSYAGKH